MSAFLPYIIFLAIWFISVACLIWWLTKRFIPSIEREMDERGLNEVQKRIIISRAVFPPKFHK